MPTKEEYAKIKADPVKYKMMMDKKKEYKDKLRAELLEDITKATETKIVMINGKHIGTNYIYKNQLFCIPAENMKI